MHLDYDLSQHEVRLMCLDPKALAYQWIVEYARNLSDMAGSRDSIDATELIETAMSHMDGGWGDYIVRGGAFEGYSVDKTFWDKLSILLDKEVPAQNRNNFFSCSC